jgi:endonuclease-3
LTRSWEALFEAITGAIGADFAASVNRIADAEDRPDPFKVLVSTIISLRTRDEVTFAASRRLFSEASTPADVGALDRARLESLIYPAGFYRVKAGNILEICSILQSRHAGRVPHTIGELTALPGVGRKTANLVLGLGFGIPAICVDIHVHRITNRLGIVATGTPDATERSLAAIVPRRYWIAMNEWLVGFGQRVCTPQSPRCSECPLADECPRVGVTRSR